MSLTRFTHGILAFPTVGANRFSGMWTNRVLFVDGDNGSDGFDGTDPANAMKTIDAAVTAASADDTIYVRPMSTATTWDTLYSATAPTSTYLDNVTIAPLTKNGLSIIGTGNGLGVAGQAVQWMGVSGIALPTAYVKSAFVNIENINFGFMAAQTTQGVVQLYNGVTPDTVRGYAYGCSIVHCGFEYNTSSNAAIWIESAPGCRVEDCTFRNVKVGIQVASNDHTVDVCYILRNRFLLSAVTNGANCIAVGTAYNMVINDNYFGHGLPTAGTYDKYIYCSGTVSGTVQGNYFGVTGVALGTINTLSNLTGGGNFSLQGPFTS